MDSMDDDSFRVRVQKVFGSLSCTRDSSSSHLHVPWSLTDDEVQKREWNRDKERGSTDRDDEATPCSSEFDGLLRKGQRSLKNYSKNIEEDLQDLDDDIEHGTMEESDEERDAWEVRCSIGMDPTLDNEEEEDLHDKVALGQENAGERLYMKDVGDSSSYFSSQNRIPKPLNLATKDPRANHLAAEIRLKEDETSSTDRHGVKPILKRKEKTTNSISQKRVRFDPSLASAGRNHPPPLEEGEGEGQDSLRPRLEEDTPQVPDYILNPSKYTRYSFDLSEEVKEEESNARACMNFLKLVKKPDPASFQLPKSVTFVPRTSNCDGPRPSKNSTSQTRSQIGIAAGESQESEASEMESDEPGEDEDGGSAGNKKSGRQYRTKHPEMTIT